jgi:protection-of-telomeres protein 1
MGTISLITSFNTEIHILKSPDIPRDNRHNRQLPWNNTSPSHKKSYNTLSSVDMSYVVWAIGKADEMGLPTEQEFQERTVRAINIKDKFSLLKNVRAGQYNDSQGFYDLVGQVVKVFQTSKGWVEIQFTDYTPNSLFYDRVYEDQVADDDNSDVYGYGNKTADESDTRAWKGPFGKLTISITLFDENASRGAAADEWLLLKNVKICKSDSGSLQGKLNADRGRIMIQALDPTKEPLDPRLKEALQRKRDYWKTFDHKNKQKSSQIAGQKRKSAENDPPALNSKERRKRAREAGEKKASAKDSKVSQALGLNENGKKLLRREFISNRGNSEMFLSNSTYRRYL